MLKTKFKTLCQNFSKDEKLINTLWKEIKIAYSQPNRHYHTLKHLEQFYIELVLIDTVTAFAIFYHDIVYDASRNDNEEESAKLSNKQLTLLGLPPKLVEKITQLINETKTHQTNSNHDALFLDADLAILGSSKKTYAEYIGNIRKEYAIYDDTTYKCGRKKVLKNFLEKPKIYQSSYFYNKYEKQAQQNIIIEYNSLIS